MVDMHGSKGWEGQMVLTMAPLAKMAHFMLGTT